jgi:hypothetical protein
MVQAEHRIEKCWPVVVMYISSVPLDDRKLGITA